MSEGGAGNSLNRDGHRHRGRGSGRGRGGGAVGRGFGRGRGRGGGRPGGHGSQGIGPGLLQHVLQDDLQIPPPPRTYISPLFEEDPWNGLPGVPFDPISLLHPGCGSGPSVKQLRPPQQDGAASSSLPTGHGRSPELAIVSKDLPDEQGSQTSHLGSSAGHPKAKPVNEEELRADDDDDDIL